MRKIAEVRQRRRRKGCCCAVFARIVWHSFGWLNQVTYIKLYSKTVAQYYYRKLKTKIAENTTQNLNHSSSTALASLIFTKHSKKSIATRCVNINNHLPSPPTPPHKHSTAVKIDFPRLLTPFPTQERIVWGERGAQPRQSIFHTWGLGVVANFQPYFNARIRYLHPACRSRRSC